MNQPPGDSPQGGCVSGAIEGREWILKAIQGTAGGRVWRTAVYIRLSRDDGREESLSVANQRKVIGDFLARDCPGEIQVRGTYIDDGESGTDYDRPAFRKMLSDMERGEIDCVICKNLSRMFRNYADQGYFLEKIFPKYGIRFMTVSEPRVDTFLHPETLDGLEVPISGLMNDRYAAKTSRDVRTTFAAKRRKGEFIGAFAPYGYQKSPENKNALAPDEDAARVVRMIYDWFLRGEISKNEIARRLNALKIPNPTAYKHQKGLRYSNPQTGRNDGLWSARSVSCILRNPVYMGTMVQGRQTVVSYKVHEKRAVPRADWYVVPGAHEAIISPGDFERAQALQERGGRAVQGQLHLFAGLLRCADCGKAMTRRESKKRVYYYCGTYRAKSKERCTPHSLREEAVKGVVLEVLRAQLSLSGSASQIAARVKSRPGRTGALRQLLMERQRACVRLERLADGLYEYWKNNDLSREEYLRLKERYRGEIEQLRTVCAGMERRISELALAEAPTELAFFLERRDIRLLSRGLLRLLVRQIAVHEDGALEIELRCTDVFRALAVRTVKDFADQEQE